LATVASEADRSSGSDSRQDQRLNRCDKWGQQQLTCRAYSAANHDLVRVEGVNHVRDAKRQPACVTLDYGNRSYVTKLGSVNQGRAASVACPRSKRI
jgi:hypothetical protein